MQRRLLLLAATFALGARAQPVIEKRPAEIPYRRESVPGFDAGRWAAGVGAALAVGGGALWWLRRRVPGGLASPRERRIKVLETLRVSQRTTLLLIEVDGRTLLVGEQAGALVLLTPPEGADHG